MNATTTTPAEPVPTTEVRTSVRRERRPSTISIDIDLEGRGADRNAAYSEFQKGIAKFKELVEALGEAIDSSKVGIPSETEDEVEKTFRSVTETVVSTVATITVTTTEGLGGLLVQLLERGVKFNTPRFDYPEVGEITPVDYEKVCAKARQIAESAARGSGCRIGRVLSIEFPSVEAGTRRSRPFGNTRLWSDVFDLENPRANYLLSIDTFAPDPELLGLLSSNVPVYEDEFAVQVTYELLN